MSTSWRVKNKEERRGKGGKKNNKKTNKKNTHTQKKVKIYNNSKMK